jgi:hypothetical protein
MYESGAGAIDVEATQRCTAESLAMKISTLTYGPDCHAQIVEAIREYHAPFGESVSMLLDEANKQNTDVAKSSVLKRRLKADGETIEGEQTIDSTNYYTETDWHTFRDKSALVPMKLATVAARLRKWGVKHLGQSSRRYPVAIILGCHFGIWADRPAGHQLPPGVTYKQLHDWTVLLANLVRSGTALAGPFTEYIPEYETDPFKMLPELIEYASDGESLVEGELQHWSALCACVPLRANNKLILDEVARQKMSGPPTHHQPEAATRVSAEINGCAPGIFGLPQLGWYSDERPADRTQPSDSIVESFRPKLRRFEPRDAAEKQADNAWPGEQWNTPVANKWTAWSPSETDWRTTPAKAANWEAKPARNAQLAVRDVAWPAWGAKSSDGEWQPHRDDSAWQQSRDEWKESPNGGCNAIGWEDTSDAQPSKVKQYEQQTLARMQAAPKRGAKALKQRPASAAAMLKRPAARAAGAGNLKRTAARAAGAGNNDTDDTPLPKVNIKEIMQRGIAESCTKDAFLRRGWAIGQKVALGKGLTKGTPEASRYTKAGYENAKTYLQSIGVM